MHAALVQFKPRKGDFVANLAAMRDVFAQLASAPNVPELIVFPEAALTGYFLEGAVYELAQPAGAFAVIVGGAITRPQQITARFAEALRCV